MSLGLIREKLSVSAMKQSMGVGISSVVLQIGQSRYGRMIPKPSR